MAYHKLKHRKQRRLAIKTKHFNEDKEKRKLNKCDRIKKERLKALRE